MNLVQFVDQKGARWVAARTGEGFHAIRGVRTMRELATAAIAAGHGLEAEVRAGSIDGAVDIEAAYAEGRILSPIDLDDPAHIHLTGTGLTHLGSASARDAMHKKLSDDGEERLTDSMKMFRMGLEGGKPDEGETGVQPEWFYKGNGAMLARPGGDLVSPAFAEDAGEEPEIAGIYLIGENGAPYRLGFALANEFSDHVTERVNYLWLAHSKLRPCSVGPELMTGDLPVDIRGTSRILRDGAVIWEKPFLSGEANMSHTIANLEHHHFKYEVFRQPGDIHIHMFGTATLSFADGVSTRDGDLFEIEAPPFGLPLRNRVASAPSSSVAVKVL